eukprot:71652_1
MSATITALKQLRISYDRYCIILFNDKIIMSSDLMILANDKNILESISYLENINVCGRTNINDGLLTAINTIKNDIKLLIDKNEINFYMNQLIIVTDGEPNVGENDTNKIILNVQNANKNGMIKIFAFGVGSDANNSLWVNDLNHSFLKLLAVNNNGLYKRIKQHLTETFLEEYYNILSKPILSNIEVKYDNKNIKNLTQTKFNTLYSGNDIIICGEIDMSDIKQEELDLNVIICAISGQEIKENNKLITKPINVNKIIKISINLNDEYKENEECKFKLDRLYAYLKLQEFIKQKLINNSFDDNNNNNNKAMILAMKYQFITPWTSMIVVKK